MEALPAGPAPAPRNQMIVGATLVAIVMAMLTGGMLGVWALKRRQAIDLEGTWLPSSVTIPEVPTNVMLIAFAGVCSFAQWAIWSAQRFHWLENRTYASNLGALDALDQALVGCADDCSIDGVVTVISTVLCLYCPVVVAEQFIQPPMASEHFRQLAGDDPDGS